MAEISKPQSVKPTLEVSIATALTLAANKFISNPDLRIQATTAAPFIGAGTAWGLRWIRRQIAYQRLVKLETRWLQEAIAERNKPGLSRNRCKELDADIASRRQSLENLQRENTKVQ